MNVYFFGDSIFTGQLVSINYNWIYRISMALSKDNVNVTNVSANRTTRQALDVLFYEIKNTPDIFVIQFGLNDCNYWDSDHGFPRVNIHSFKANLIEISRKARVLGAKKIFINTNHPSQKSKKHKENNKNYNIKDMEKN